MWAIHLSEHRRIQMSRECFEPVAGQVRDKGLQVLSIPGIRSLVPVPLRPVKELVDQDDNGIRPDMTGFSTGCAISS